MTIHKCDRCGKIIEDYDSNSRDQEYIIARMKNSPDEISANCDIDLCEDCYKQFLSWMQGINIVSDFQIEAAESVGFRQGFKMAEKSNAMRGGMKC